MYNQQQSPFGDMDFEWIEKPEPMQWLYTWEYLSESQSAYRHSWNEGFQRWMDADDDVVITGWVSKALWWYEALSTPCGGQPRTQIIGRR